MDTIKQVILQEENEKRYNRKHIDGYILGVSWLALMQSQQ